MAVLCECRLRTGCSVTQQREGSSGSGEGQVKVSLPRFWDCRACWEPTLGSSVWGSLHTSRVVVRWWASSGRAGGGGPREEVQRQAAWLPAGVRGDEGLILALG